MCVKERGREREREFNLTMVSGSGMLTPLKKALERNTCWCLGIRSPEARQIKIILHSSIMLGEQSQGCKVDCVCTFGKDWNSPLSNVLNWVSLPYGRIEGAFIVGWQLYKLDGYVKPWELQT